MTAQEMFEEIGFRKNKSKCYNEQHILYEKPVMNETDIFTIEFKNEHVIYTNSMNCCLKTPWYLIRAIHQQMKELGWIE